MTFNPFMKRPAALNGLPLLWRAVWRSSLFLYPGYLGLSRAVETLDRRGRGQ